MALRSIAIQSPGDMGHAVGRALRASGHDVITCLAGRSEHTRLLAEKAELRDVPDFETMVSQADIVLSILPPEAAKQNAIAIADAMRQANAKPVFADCNAIAPETMRQVSEIIQAAGAPVIDAGIIGRGPGHGTPTRFYASGPDTTPLEELARSDLLIKPLGPEIGRASAMKMCYAALTKGTFTLQTAVLVAAEALGLQDELREEFQFSQKAAYERMQAVVPRIPADSERWIGEMQEIAATFEAAGVTPAFHQGAAWVFELLAQTPFAAETRETLDPNRTLEDAVRVYAEYLDGKASG